MKRRLKHCLTQSNIFSPFLFKIHNSLAGLLMWQGTLISCITNSNDSRTLYNGGTKSRSFFYRMQYGISTIVKTRFKATHCHAWSSPHKGKSLWSDQNPAQRASLFLNKQALPHFSLVWLIPDSVLHWVVHSLELSSGTRSHCQWDAGAPQEYHFSQQHGKQEMLNWEKLRVENQVQKDNILE